MSAFLSCSKREARMSNEPPPMKEPQRSFFPRLDPSTPVSELFQATLVRLLVAFWIPCVLLLVAIGTGAWQGPPNVEYPSAAKNWESEELRQIALSAYQRRKAFDGIWDAAFVVAVSGPLALGLGLYVLC